MSTLRKFLPSAAPSWGLTSAGVGDGGTTWAPILSSQLARNSSGSGDSDSNSARTTLGLACGRSAASQASDMVSAAASSGMFTFKMSDSRPAGVPFLAFAPGLVCSSTSSDELDASP